MCRSVLFSLAKESQWVKVTGAEGSSVDSPPTGLPRRVEEAIRNKSLTKCVKRLQVREAALGTECIFVEAVLLEAAVHVSHQSSGREAADMQFEARQASQGGSVVWSN